MWSWRDFPCGTWYQRAPGLKFINIYIQVDPTPPLNIFHIFVSLFRSRPFFLQVELVKMAWHQSNGFLLHLFNSFVKRWRFDIIRILEKIPTQSWLNTSLSKYSSRVRLTLQKKELCAQLFDLEKPFKNCYVYEKRKPKYLVFYLEQLWVLPL